MAALTATSGPSQRRKIMKLLCFRAHSEVILDSPDRENIKISSLCIPNKDNLEKVFTWLIDTLKSQKEKAERHIIFCESIAEVSKIYAMFIKQFGHNSKLFEMFHSKTNEKVKEKIRNDMTVDGDIRILICTNAAGMGVNFFGVHNIIHFNLPRLIDTFVQQMGRAGRDGEFSNELILYRNHKSHLKKVENDLIRMVKDDSKCKHELLCGAYLISHKKIVPSHNCCDTCAKQCSCEDEQCPRTHAALTVINDTESDSSEEVMHRYVSDSERQLINQKLMSYKYTLTSACSGFIVDSNVVHGLTDEVVTNIVANCNTIYTCDDIMGKFPIWSFQTAVEICNIICDVLGDMDMYNLLENTEEDFN